MAKRLTNKQKEEIVQRFTGGETIESLSENFSCTQATIVRNLKRSIGEELYKELTNKNKFSRENPIISEDNRISHFSELVKTDKKLNEDFSTDKSFVEISPLDYQIEDSNRKEFSSVPISEVNFPKIVYMIVDKKIELEIKLLKDYPEWQFLPNDDMNRKTIEIYLDLNIAKRICNKEQKVIKVPNTEVFRIAAPLLISRGISRIVSSEKLIAL